MEKYATLTNNNTQQIQLLIEQNQRIEDFLDEIVGLLRKNQKTSVELNQKLISAESDMNLYKKELGDLFKDFETRYGYFQSVTQADGGNMVKMQRETNKTLETFMNVMTKRSGSLEEATKERLDSFQALVEQISRKELNDEYLRNISVQITEFESKLAMSDKKLGNIEGRLGNFRNEINTLLVDYETDVNKKWNELTQAIGHLSKATGVRNPLLV